MNSRYRQPSMLNSHDSSGVALRSALRALTSLVSSWSKDPSGSTTSLGPQVWAATSDSSSDRWFSKAQRASAHSPSRSMPFPSSKLG